MLKKNEKKEDWTESKLKEQRSNTEQTWNPSWTFNLAKHGEQIKIGKYILDSCLGTVQEMPTI